jgi:hypothetical protein
VERDDDAATLVRQETPGLVVTLPAAGAHHQVRVPVANVAAGLHIVRESEAYA